MLGGLALQGMAEDGLEGACREAKSGRQVFICEISLLADAVVAVSSAAWLSGAMPCLLMARTSKS